MKDSGDSRKPSVFDRPYLLRRSTPSNYRVQDELDHGEAPAFLTSDRHEGYRRELVREIERKRETIKCPQAKA